MDEALNHEDTMSEKLDISAETQLVETQALLAFYQNRCLVLAQVGNDLHQRNQALEAELAGLRPPIAIAPAPDEPALIPSNRRKAASADEVTE
jgi:hypothetical protein